MPAEDEGWVEVDPTSGLLMSWRSSRSESHDQGWIARRAGGGRMTPRTSHYDCRQSRFGDDRNVMPYANRHGSSRWDRHDLRILVRADAPDFDQYRMRFGQHLAEIHGFYTVESYLSTTDPVKTERGGLQMSWRSCRSEVHDLLHRFARIGSIDLGGVRSTAGPPPAKAPQTDTPKSSRFVCGSLVDMQVDTCLSSG